MRNKMQYTDDTTGHNQLLDGGQQIVHIRTLDGLGQFGDYLGFSAVIGLLLDQQIPARLYLDRIAQVQALFRFAQMIISSDRRQVGVIDFSDVSSAELQLYSPLVGFLPQVYNFFLLCSLRKWRNWQTRMT